MKLYTEEQLRQTFRNGFLYSLTNQLNEDAVIDSLTPIELPSDLDTLKKIIENRPAEFSGYNAYTLLFVIDLIQNGKEVPESRELVKIMMQNK